MPGLVVVVVGVRGGGGGVNLGGGGGGGGCAEQGAGKATREEREEEEEGRVGWVSCPPTAIFGRAAWLAAAGAGAILARLGTVAAETQ